MIRAKPGALFLIPSCRFGGLLGRRRMDAQHAHQKKWGQVHIPTIVGEKILIAGCSRAISAGFLFASFFFFILGICRR
ncbi:MAG: hypothetical protein Q8L40_03295 [Burkholderiales bacterium]|nr:hypothetical protein [Burkholderiales bacterium]